MCPPCPSRAARDHGKAVHARRVGWKARVEDRPGGFAFRDGGAGRRPRTRKPMAPFIGVAEVMVGQGQTVRVRAVVRPVGLEALSTPGTGGPHLRVGRCGAEPIPGEFGSHCLAFARRNVFLSPVDKNGTRSRAEGDSRSAPKKCGSISADPTARRPEATPEGASVSSDRRAQIRLGNDTSLSIVCKHLKVSKARPGRFLHDSAGIRHPACPARCRTPTATDRRALARIAHQRRGREPLPEAIHSWYTNSSGEKP